MEGVRTARRLGTDPAVAVDGDTVNETMVHMNRRNVLIGMGTIVAGGGAALGTGAFSQVEADRTVSINTTDDAQALLQFTVDDDYNGVESTGDVVEITLSGLNDEAVTTFNGVLTVTNSGSQEVTLTVSDVPAAFTFYNEAGEDIESSSVTLSDEGGSEALDLEVDLVDHEVDDDGAVTFDASA